MLILGERARKKLLLFEDCSIRLSMNATNLAKELAEIIASQGLSQRALAAKAGLSSAGISYLLSGTRPDADTLAAVIIHATDSPEIRQRLVLAHLRDEVERAGHSPADYSLMPASQVEHVAQVQAVASLHPALLQLVVTSLKVPELLATLLDLAALSARYETKAVHLEAAEGPGSTDLPAPKSVTYGKKKK